MMLKDAMARAGLNGAQLAGLAGCTPPEISRLVTGSRKITADWARRLAPHLGIDPADLVPRPWFMGEVKDGFAVIVTGESMVPAFDPGDMAIVNPRLPFMRGKVHIFTSESIDDHYKATIKTLVGVTTKAWKVQQFNPPKTFELPRDIWTHARRVVGKYSG